MSFFSKVFKSKELKAFERALDNRDFSTAIEIGQSSDIPSDLVQEAKDRLAISQAIQTNNQDLEKKKYLDQVLDSMDNPKIYTLIKDRNIQGLVLLGLCKRAILTQNYDSAIELAEKIQDKDLQTHVLRKIAGFASTDSSKLNIAIRAILKFSDENLQSDALYKLSLSREILGDFDAANVLLEEFPTTNYYQSAETVISFVAENKDEDIDKVKTAAIHDDSGITRHRMATIYALRKDINGMIKTLEETDPQYRANIFSIFAQALGFSGLHEEALTLLREIEDSNKRYQEFVYFLTFIPFSHAIISAVIVEMEGLNPKSAKEYLGIFMTELAFSNQMQYATELISKLENKELQKAVVDFLSDSSYVLYSVKGSTSM